MVNPRSNLGASDPWARALTLEVSNAARDVGVLSRTVDNTLRANQGQMSRMAEQISEIQAQQEEILSQVTVTATAPVLTLNYPAGYGLQGPVNQMISLEGPQGGNRNAILFFSTRVKVTGDNVGVSMELRQDGVSIWQGDGTAYPTAQSFTPVEGVAYSAAVPVKVPLDSDAQFQLRMYGYRTFSGVATQIRATETSLALQYGTRY